MALIGAGTKVLWSSGSNISSITVNFPQANVMAQTALNYVDGDGAHKIGIVSFKFKKNGQTITQDFGEWYNWPNTVFSETMISVTFGVATGGGQYIEGFANMFWWG